MNDDNTDLLEAWNTFTIELPRGWTRANDRDYYTEFYGPTAGYDHALVQIVKTYTALDTTVRSAIGFLHGAINPDMLELVDTLPFQRRIELLKNLIHRAPPPNDDVALLILDLNHCLTVESQHNRILSAVLADPEHEAWLYKLHRLSDYLWTVNNDLRELMESAYADYVDHVGILPSTITKGRSSWVRAVTLGQM
jgi:hypothetical protein